MIFGPPGPLRPDHKHRPPPAVVNGPGRFDFRQGPALERDFEAPGRVASSKPSMQAASRSNGMLPMPLPMSSIADERKTALGSVMSGALTDPIWTTRIGTASAAALAAAISRRSA